MKNLTAFLGLSFAVAIADAQPTDSTNPGTALAPVFLAMGIAYLTRRMAIGGWLFYYYLSLFVAAPITALLAVTSLPNLYPFGLDDMTLYLASILSSVLWLGAFTVNFVLSIRLLFKSRRNKRNTVMVRYSLLAVVITAALGAAIDYAYFPEYFPIGVITLVFSSVWSWYFFASKRVDYVLAKWTGEWDYEAFKAS